MRPDAAPAALTPQDEADFAAAGIVADEARPGRWRETRGNAERGLTTTEARRRAHRDLADPTNGRAPAGATAEALIEPTEQETDSMETAYTEAASAQPDPGTGSTPETVDPYEAFVAAKRVEARVMGFLAEAISAVLFPFQRDCVRWALERGCAALFESFGLGKTFQHLEAARQVLAKEGGRFLIVAPLGVRAEFVRDAATLGVSLTFVRTDAEVPSEGLCLTNYEAVRDGRVDPRRFVGVSLDEVQCLRGGGKTKMFREFMALFEGSAIRYRLIMTATPAPNEYEEILVYAAFLGVMDQGAAKTRWFKRDSTKADNLRLHPHKAAEFWAWVSTWALFVTKPSDLGYSDEGYALPPLSVHWHDLPSDHAKAGVERSGQARLLADSAAGIVEASREKRRSLDARVAKVVDLVLSLRTETPEPGATGHAASGLSDQVVVWCDLNPEQEAIEAELARHGITCSSMYGRQTLDAREALVARWKNRETSVFLSKPVMYGAGVNLQQCHTMVFAGIGYKFADFIQAVHRIYRFLQLFGCDVHLIHTTAEASVRRELESKWRAHDELVATMTAIVREHGLARSAMSAALGRATDVLRREVTTERCVLVNNDTVRETRRVKGNSIHLILTSIPFGNQYEYCPSFFDFGHTDDPAHFFAQMDHLTPELLRVLAPGRVLAVHVKDRIVPGGLTGLGFQTLYPFHADCIAHYTRHGFALLGMVTIVTDVVRENNQTYRLAYTEQCKDGSRQGVGVPEYLLLFRKPQSDRSKGYADTPVVKLKEEYSLGRWQIDASGFHRSSGDRLLSAEDFRGLTHDQMFKVFRRWNLGEVYDYERHVALNESLEARGALPVDFSLLQPHSWSEHVWTDVARMRTLNSTQALKGREQHLCIARDSLVLTRNGYRPIQDVAVGDEVLTHRGRWRPVVAAQCTGVRPVVTLTAQGVAGLTLTPDHKVWTRPVRDIAWARNHSRKEAARVEPTWVQAKDTVGSYVNARLPPVEASALSAADWWIVGRWLGDGHMSARGPLITFDESERDELLGAMGTRAGAVYRSTTALQVYVKGNGGKGGHHDDPLHLMLRKCGRGAAGKQLPPEALALEPSLAAALLDGYLSADGHYLHDRRRWMATSASRALLLGVAALALRAHGSVASVFPGRPARESVIQGRAVHCRQEWLLSFDMPGERRAKQFVLDDGAWKRVRSCALAGEVEVWDLRVAEDESFTVEGCIVHNCPFPIDIVDRAIRQYSMPGEVVFDPFAGLLTVPARAVTLGRLGRGHELSARYFDDGLHHVWAAERRLAVPTLFDLDAALVTDAAGGAEGGAE